MPKQSCTDAETMIDWSLVKSITLWDYEELIEKVCYVFSYSFVQEHYNHSMKEATDYAIKLFEYNIKYANRISTLANSFRVLEKLRIENYADLIHRVDTKEKCEGFLVKTHLQFETVISVVNYVFRWVLPHSLYLRELVDLGNDSHSARCIEKLRLHKIRFNLDLLEQGRTRKGREKITKETGITESFILNLVNLADLSRLPYSNRKTVKHLSAAGYASVSKLAQTDSEELMKDMKSYFEKVGVRLAGFIDVKGIAQWSRCIPTVIEN